ncbi:MAG: BamA/TamA family outer membrane protein, partial [Longimicrobiales bacterium]
FGPVIQTRGSSPTRVEALGVLRTGAGDLFETEHMGYQLRVEQFLGTRALRMGGVLRSMIEPIEAWNLSNLEASLATFLLHDDQRDYFEREGWGAYVRWSPRSSGFGATIGYWDEEHSARAARDPWTLFGNGAWRAQPLVGEGRLQAISGRIQYDGRNDDEVPTSGIYLSIQGTHGLSGNLVLPERQIPDSVAPITLAPFSLDANFTSGLVDLRLYRSVSRDGSLALRGVAGGSLEERALPPQFQFALGGPGTLPGYSLFRGDCGARSVPVASNVDGTAAFFPSYGCDRFALGSVEYRGGFNLDFGGDFDAWGNRENDRSWHIDASPNWMLFFNAGKGWALGDSRARGSVDTEVLYDAGAGLMLGDFGVYAAFPLTGQDRDVRFLVRLGARF